MIEKEFIPYQEALALKELGFDEPCLMAYFKYTLVKSNIIQLLKPLDNIYGINYFFKNSSEEFKDNSISGDGDGAKCSSPTFSQAFRFFREKYSIDFEISNQNTLPEKRYRVFLNKDWWYSGHNEFKQFDSYEEAELECLKKLIEICQKK